MGKNVVILGVNTSSSVHIDNKKKDILILGFGPTRGLTDTTLSAETQYSINFQDQIENYNGFIIMGATVFYLLMLEIYINSKQNILKLKNLLCV